MVSIISNDLLENKLCIICVRFFILVVFFPVILVAHKSPSMLSLFPTFLFGCVFYGHAKKAPELTILTSRLCSNDWSVFWVFVVTPDGSMIFLPLAVAFRIGSIWVSCKVQGRRFYYLDKLLSREDDVVSGGDESPSSGLENPEKRNVAW